MRFRLAENGHRSTVNITECSDGVKVLERVLRKFGKLGSGPGNVTEVDSDEGGLCIDGWLFTLTGEKMVLVSIFSFCIFF